MSPSGLARFVAGRFWMNLKSSFEYRASFWSQVIFMIANNTFLLWFWQIFFSHFGHVRDWNLQDMYLLYGICTTSFGLANILAGGSIELAGTIADGELDYFIGLPPPTLLHAIVTKLRVSTIGDMLFGIALLVMLYHGEPAKLLLAFALCVPSAIVFVSVAVLGSSLAFFLGESRGITFQLVNLVITFGTYPEAIFQGSLKWVLYLLIPAGLFSHLPAHVMHDAFSHPGAMALSTLELLLGAGLFALAAILVFRRGLRNYTSGSSMAIRI